jgi:hypothetical protein
MTRAAAKTGLGSIIPVAIEQHYPEKRRIFTRESPGLIGDIPLYKELTWDRHADQ